MGIGSQTDGNPSSRSAEHRVLRSARPSEGVLDGRRATGAGSGGTGGGLGCLRRRWDAFHRAGAGRRPDGSEVGRIAQENMVGKIRFGMEADGKRVGGIQGENGERGTSRSRTDRAPRSAGSLRLGRASLERCSRRRTTTSCRSTSSCKTRCARSWSPPRYASTPPSSRTSAASTRRSTHRPQAAGSTSRSSPVRTS